ncbi:hypothetical protein ACFC58_13480 [Kitasatospora purpeofusca]|uniref:hypothetical protein n=1 Tax=Kitasatospora purpeofusca TaxID=67352 RepID=UPI0035DC1DAF
MTCPWHGSVFRLSDGWNVGGPATAPPSRSSSPAPTATATCKSACPTPASGCRPARLRQQPRDC